MQLQFICKESCTWQKYIYNIFGCFLKVWNEPLFTEVFHHFEFWHNIDHLSVNWLGSIFYLQTFLTSQTYPQGNGQQKNDHALILFYQHFLRNYSVAPHQYSAKQIFCLFMIFAISHIMKKSLCRPCKIKAFYFLIAL